MRHAERSAPSAAGAPESASPPGYRPDIDGLRAVAVTAVVAYHAFPNTLRGGLVGVDIFFVISGFLITGIILEGLLTRRFRFLDFYVRRVKRIFPALAVVLASCLLCGWILLYDVEYQPLGKHVAGGAAFISNFVLSNESGYFDSQSDYKELLHLWSLGIEEQFYLLFPLILAVCWKNVRTALPLIGTILLASFVLNVWLIGRQPAETFYLPMTRFWELMIGAALAYAAVSHRIGAGSAETQSLSRLPRVAREVCSWTGVLLIGAALCVVNEGSAFPGWLALLPTLGALLVIAAGPAASFNRYVLCSRPFIFIGLISYPLYLWHWPLLSFQRVLTPENPGRLSRALLVCLSILLAWLTWRFIERPVRHFRRPSLLAAALCVVMAGIGTAGLAVYWQQGFPARAANTRNLHGREMLAEAKRQDTRLRHERYPVKPCSFVDDDSIPQGWCESFGADHGKTIVLWGDSHATAWSPVFYEIAERQQLKVVRFSVGGCPPLLGTRRIDPIFADAPCASFGQAEKVLKIIHALKPAHIFMLARWSMYTPSKVAAQAQALEAATEADRPYDVLGRQLVKTLDALPAGTPVTLFRTAPVLRNEPDRALLRDTPVEMLQADYVHGEAAANFAIDAAVAPRRQVSVFDPSPIFCSHRCESVLRGTVLYANATHLSAQGAMLALDEVSRRYFGPTTAPQAQ